MRWPGTIRKIQEAFRNKSLTVERLTRHYLDGIERLQPQLNAFITVTAETAIKTARERDSELRMGSNRGPLHGVPLAIKDDIDVENERCTVGSAIFDQRFSTKDAHVVQKLRKAGAIILGKTNMNEMAAGGRGGFNPYYGDTVNPWSAAYEPGGSSSGSAVAVASGLCAGALGTDSGGSIRGPAARCGVIGLRPTLDLIPTTDVFPRCPSYNTVGILTRSATDAAILFDVLAGKDQVGPGKISIKDRFNISFLNELAGLRVGVIKDFTLCNLSSEVETALRKSLKSFTDFGAEVIEIEVPALKKAPGDAEMAEIIFYEFYRTIRSDYFRAKPSLFGDIVHSDVRKAATIEESAYNAAITERKSLRKEIFDTFQSVDILVTPTFPDMHMRASAKPDFSGKMRRFTIPVSYFGLPAISVNCGFSRALLPIGMQIIGAPGDEALILNFAYTFEKLNNLGNCRPTVFWG